MLRYILISFLLLLAQSANAQFRDSVKGAKVIVDTGHFHMQKSPTLALVLSGVLPGAGQIYTGGWYKAPFIVAGIAGCFIGAAIQNARYHVDIDSVNNQIARGDTYNANRYTAQREFYRDDRDKFYIYAGLVYIINLLDAYISAHLFDFDVSEPTGAYLEAPRTREEPWRLAVRIGFSFLLFSSCVTTHSLSNEFEKDIYIGKLTFGKQFGNFINAQAISIDAFGFIYVADAGAPGIIKYNLHGDSIRGVIALGKEHDQFDGPIDIDASLTNSVAVADRNNHRIEIYSKDLIWQASISGHEKGSKIQFGYPMAVRSAPSGNIFIIDGENKRALSIQPANGTQQVITLSGTESGIEMNPVSLSLGANEFATIADANSRSLIIFNNAYLPQVRVRYSPVNESKLSSSENLLYSLDHNANVLRIFDAENLSYQGSLALPEEVNHAAGCCVYKGEYYILTKEKVVVCLKN